MKNHRNIDVWLERACHLTVVGLSVTAAFLLRFDFAIPTSVIPILKQSLLIAILVKLPIFDWVGILPEFAPIRQHSGPLSGFSGERGRLCAVRRDVDVLDRAGNAAIGADHRRGLVFCGHGAGTVLGPNL